MTKQIFILILILTGLRSIAEAQAPSTEIKPERISRAPGRIGVQLAAQARSSKSQETTRTLPPLPTGVSELKFSDFFVMPIGDRGLTFTEKLRGLEGKRVRILGYMVHQDQPVASGFLLAPMPAQVDQDHYGLADDLPAATIQVVMPKGNAQVVGHVSGPLLLTGTLSLGPREEADGRISNVRLLAELPNTRAMKRSSTVPGKGAERMMK
jgi:hypothetical protein